MFTADNSFVLLRGNNPVGEGWLQRNRECARIAVTSPRLLRKQPPLTVERGAGDEVLFATKHSGSRFRGDDV